jgi:aspartate/methionine/tyrosine aminotransferase
LRKITENLETLPPSGIALLLHISEHHELLSLGIGEPNFNTPKHIMEAAIGSLRSGNTHYSPDAGTLELRKAIVEKTERDNGFTVDPETEVIVTAGTSPGVFGAILATVDKGDEVIIPSPSYFAYESIVRIVGGKPVFVPATEEDQFVPEPEKIAEAITPKTKMIIVCSPTNPTGAVWDKDKVSGVADLATDHDLLILSDELYEQLVYDGARVHSPASIGGLFERTITINGLSKSHAMTGFRLGWLIAPKEIIAGFRKIHQYGSICASTTSQAAALAALTGPDKPVKTMVAEYDRRRRLLVNRINGEIPLLSTTSSQGSFFMFVNVRELLEKHHDDMKAFLKTKGRAFLESLPRHLFSIEDLNRSGSLVTMFYLIVATKVLTVSGAWFGPGGEGFLRVSFAQTYENIDKAIDKIIEGLGYLQ